MVDRFFELFTHYHELAFVISIILNILISILAFIPSVFLTGANIMFFGFWKGTLISFLGEAIGAWISFLLFRKGFRGKMRAKLKHYPKICNLLSSQGMDAFWMIVSLRILPFVPSGLVTFTAAVGKVSAFLFVVASSLGKMPALLIEVFSVYHITAWTYTGKIILGVISVIMIIMLYKKGKVHL